MLEGSLLIYLLHHIECVSKTLGMSNFYPSNKLFEQLKFYTSHTPRDKEILQT